MTEHSDNARAVAAYIMEQSDTPQQAAFNLSYVFNQRVKGDIKKNMMHFFGGMGAILVSPFVVPALAPFALPAALAFYGWTVQQERQQNMELKEIFDSASEQGDADFRAEMRDLDDVLRPVADFGKQDIDHLKEFAGTGAGLVSMGVVGLGVLFLPLPLGLTLAALTVGSIVKKEDTITKLKVAQKSEAIGTRIAERNPGMELTI